MADDSAGGTHRGFLIGYGPTSPRNGVRVHLAGALGSEGAKLLQACGAQIRTMPVSRVCFDLSDLEAIDGAGARNLIATCSSLRRDGFQVDIHGLRLDVAAVLAARKLAMRG